MMYCHSFSQHSPTPIGTSNRQFVNGQSTRGSKGDHADLLVLDGSAALCRLCALQSLKPEELEFKQFLLDKNDFSMKVPKTCAVENEWVVTCECRFSECHAVGVLLFIKN